MYNLKCLLKAGVGRNLKEHSSNKNTDYYTETRQIVDK